MLAELDDEDGVDAATVVVGAGFTLLRLTGQIDDEGRAAVLRASPRWRPSTASSRS